MLAELGMLAIFLAKALIIVFLILFTLAMVLFIASRARGSKAKGVLNFRHLNEKLDEVKEGLLAEMLTKSEFKKFRKEQKRQRKAEDKNPSHKPKVYVLQFNGDVQASAVSSLREEITALLTIATPKDEVVVKLESPGGLVHSYGFAAAQLQRLRDKSIPLTVIVDKVAASGGYLMSCVADRLLAAPFAIIGSIGVIVQIPNFHRWMQDRMIDFEQLTAGNYKRTLTVFGKNTPEGRAKLQQELEEVHDQFKDVIQEFRKNLDIEKVATGEHWLGKQALALNLVDGLSTSDDYLLEKSKTADVYELQYESKKSLISKLKMAALQLYANPLL